MIDAEYCQMMAAYNAWMNTKLYEAAAQLPDAERKADRKAFFRSLHSTLNHILWGDRVWLPRFNGKSYPVGGVGADLYETFAELRAARTAMDDEIVGLGRGPGRVTARRHADVVLRDRPTRNDAPALALHHADVQSPDSSPRTGDDAAAAGWHRYRGDRSALGAAGTGRAATCCAWIRVRAVARSPARARCTCT